MIRRYSHTCARIRGSAGKIAFSVIAVAVLLVLTAGTAGAQQVFDGDPVDGGTRLPFPIMPGLPLVLPGTDERFGTGDDVVDTGITGDVDVAVRIGTITSAAIPPPSGAAGGPAVLQVEAGGGVTGQGAEAAFTVMVSDGTGSPPYGNVITNAELDLRPVAVFAFADFDDDGVIGPNAADGNDDAAIEQQEIFAHNGRQVGQVSAGRLAGDIGFHVAAPASMGGLKVSLSAAVYTGNDAEELFSDGTAVYTLWPVFPPLDPRRVLSGGGRPPPPDAETPAEVDFDVERNYRPDPSHPVLGSSFAVPVDGSEPTTDQVVVVSGPAVRADFFQEVGANGFRPTSRAWVRPAPEQNGSGRTYVRAAQMLSIPFAIEEDPRTLRLLPTDRLGNVADPPEGGMMLDLVATGPVAITAPDTDGDTSRESVVLTSAAGVVVTVTDANNAGTGSIAVLQGSRPLAALQVEVPLDSDLDGDARIDDGDFDGILGGTPCSQNDIPAFASCDDNCPLILNVGQFDEQLDGLGNCCDGTCIDKPTENGCNQCFEIAAPPTDPFASVKVRARAQPGRLAKIIFRARLDVASADIQPDLETITLGLLQADVLRYDGALVALLEPTGTSGTFRYVDRTGSVGGVRKAMLKSKDDGTQLLLWVAKGAGLMAVDPAAAEVSVAVGDDGFAQTLACSPGQGTIAPVLCR